MDDRGIIDVPFAEAGEMGSWNLPLKVTVQIIMYAALVDIICRQQLCCVCKHFKDTCPKFVFLIRYLGKYSHF